jgi:iron complex transport system permease protein
MVVVAVCLLTAALAHLSLGSVRIPLGQTARILAGQETVDQTWRTIVIDFRLPRVVAAIIGGAALAVGGVVMQTLFRNPLAGPFVLGINAGASLGVAIVVLGGGLVGLSPVAGSGLLAGAGLQGDALLVTASSLGAASVLLIVLAVARRVESAMTLLVLGVLFSYAVSAGVSVLMHFSIPQEIQTCQLPLFAGVVVTGLVGVAFLVKSLNALLLGETYASSMGVRVRITRIATIGVTALLAGVVTAFCGPIAFVGVAVPHLTRAILRDADHRRLIPATVLLGSTTALVADIAASLPGLRIVLPLNAVTALIGTPVVIAVILRRGDLAGNFS